jgi:sugar/nucleoside kinase (ribokinase family)
MMAKYDVYGIGNALVDMEYAVAEADLNTLGITKGVMTLVDAQQQLQIMHHLSNHAPHRSCGGSAANSMIAISQFGGTSFYTCKVANDDLGDFYMQDLMTEGVAVPYLSVKDAGHTGRCVVLVTPDSDRTLCTFLGVSSDLSTKELTETALRDSQYFYMEGYLVTSDTARHACINAHALAQQAGIKTAISLSDPNIVRFFKNGLLDMMGSGVDLLFANEEEAKGMADIGDLGDAIDYLKTLSKEFAITLGPKGALIWDGQNLLTIDPTPVQAIDTVGAGDLFAGAFLYGRTQGWSHQQAGALAALSAAQLVSIRGPRLSAATTQQILQTFIQTAAN